MEKILKIIKERCPQNHKCPAVNVCPVGALSQEGFNAPEIDYGKCIRCGKCSNFCPKKALVLESNNKVNNAKITANYVRLPLKGSENTRDLGGYPTNDNKVTKFHVYIRSSRLTNITEKDNEILKNYGITDIIDLRGVTSIQSTFVSDDNINKEYFKFHYIPLSTIEMEQYANNEHEKEDFNFGIGYTYLLDNKTKIKKIFETLADAEGGVLFHCTAGKDRTGVVSALILGLCNVDIKDIIANYEVTHTYILNSDFMDRYTKNKKKSSPEFIKTFIENLLDKYTSFENYILSCNVSKEKIEKIRDKFCE